MAKINSKSRESDVTMKTIPGKAFLDWLKREGIVPENTRRVVIDAEANSPIIIYVEMYGGDKLIEVEPPPELRVGVKIVSSDKAEQDPAKEYNDYRWMPGQGVSDE